MASPLLGFAKVEDNDQRRMIGIGLGLHPAQPCQEIVILLYNATTPEQPHAFYLMQPENARDIALELLALADEAQKGGN